MPLYEYFCDACGRKMEVIQSYSEPPASQCEHCGEPVRRLISSPAFQFKGSGFYATDYKSSGKEGGADSKSETKGDSKSDSKGDSKGESKGESKSESKSEPKTSESKADKSSSGGGGGADKKSGTGESG